jgi:hypothetical protein
MTCDHTDSQVRGATVKVGLELSLLVGTFGATAERIALTTRKSALAVEADNISWAGGETLAVALNNDTAAFA